MQMLLKATDDVKCCLVAVSETCKKDMEDALTNIFKKKHRPVPIICPYDVKNQALVVYNSPTSMLYKITYFCVLMVNWYLCKIFR